MYKIMVTLLAVICITIFSVNAYADLHPQVPGNMTYQQRQQIFNQMSNPSTVSGSNYFIMILKTPAGPELDNFIINSTDMDNIKHNVGIFTVCGSIQNSQCQPPVLTQAAPTTTYCPIATLIHFNEDGYDNFKVGNSTIFEITTPPAYCSSIPPVPEFPQVLGILLAIGTMTAIVLTVRKHKTA